MDDKQSFQQRYLAAKAEAQKYEVASGVYKQRLQEKTTALVEAHAAMLDAINNLTDTSVKDMVLGILPVSVELDRLEDIQYLQALKVVMDKTVDELEKAGNAALGK